MGYKDRANAELLAIAENKLVDAIEVFMKRGANRDLVLRVVSERIRLVESQPSIAQMRKELAKSGWVERNSTTYIAPNGHWFSGPFEAWKSMKQLASAATTDTSKEKP